MSLALLLYLTKKRIAVIGIVVREIQLLDPGLLGYLNSLFLTTMPPSLALF